jgi:hypothetical protein
MRMDEEGKLGIGTNNPTAPLHVIAKAGSPNDPSTNGIYCHNTTSGINEHAIICARVADSSSGNPFISLDVSGENGWSIGLDNADNNNLKFSTFWNIFGGYTKMTLTRDGDLSVAGTFSTGNSTLGTLSANATSITGTLTASSTITTGGTMICSNINITASYLSTTSNNGVLNLNQNSVSMTNTAVTLYSNISSINMTNLSPFSSHMLKITAANSLVFAGQTLPMTSSTSGRTIKTNYTDQAFSAGDIGLASLFDDGSTIYISLSVFR